MAEAILKDQWDASELLAPEAAASGEVFQLPDGRAAVYTGLNTAASGDKAAFATVGKFKMLKSASVVILKGSRVFWDKSGNTATPLEALGANDFYVGTAVEDAAAADATVTVDLNVEPKPVISLNRGAWETIPILTAGTATLFMRGAMAEIVLSATAEAQKVDLLSKQSVIVANGFICEFDLAMYDNGDDAALDINVGMANATHATDADAITESVFIHIDGNDLNIFAESDDGTTEVVATDTTVDYVDDTFFHVAIDARDLTDIQIYINGILVLGATVFKLDAATGPMKFLAHVEKTSNDTPADVRIANVEVRTSDWTS